MGVTVVAEGRDATRTRELEATVTRLDREVRRLQRRILVMERGYVQVMAMLDALGGGSGE